MSVSVVVPDYLQPYLKHSLLSADEERSCLIRAHSGDAHARRVLHRHNLRLLVDRAMRFLRDYPCLDFDELFQACFEGLNKAIDEFDLSLPSRLITFAHWKILNEMQAVARRVALHSKRYSSQSVELELSHHLQPLEQIELQEFVALCREKRRTLWKTLQLFPRKIRKLIVLRLLGHKFKQIGDRLGFSGQTASNKFNKYFPRFRRLLRRRLRPRCQFRQSLSIRISPRQLAIATIRPRRVSNASEVAVPLQSCALIPSSRWPRVRVANKIFRHSSLSSICNKASVILKRSFTYSVPLPISSLSPILRWFALAVYHLVSCIINTLFSSSIRSSVSTMVPSTQIFQEVRGSPV